mmetsp:Transcript_744/g.1380  ORF Transcript_744/g.1380 Transcript_744/m.1380 type:complete len:460 (+) Transcript_744:30-1409(+)
MDTSPAPRPKLREPLDLTPEKVRKRGPPGPGLGASKSQRRADSKPSLTAAEIELDVSTRGQPYPLTAREKECGVVDEFLETCLKPEGRSSCLYLSGGPGTGKTSTARGAAWSRRSEHLATRILEINCMDLQPCSIPGFLLKVIEACSSAAQQEKRADLTPRSPLSSLVAAAISGLQVLGDSIILIVDEVDQVVRKSKSGDTSLETLCRLPRQPGAPSLAILMIANHVDLLVRACGPKVSALCSRLLFEAYTLEQLRTIAKARFAAAGEDGVRAEAALGGKVALELRLRKVSNSGDCRNIVRLCEAGFAEAAAMQEDGEGADGPKTLQQVQQECNAMNYDPVQDVRNLPSLYQVLLGTFFSSDKSMLTSEVFQKYRACVAKLRRPVDSKPLVIAALSTLEQRGLLCLRKKRQSKGGKGKAGKGTSVADEQIVSLAVSHKRLREAIRQADPGLLHCFDAEE